MQKPTHSSAKTLFSNPCLDRCWVCGCLLADKGGNPASIRESHHVVPRAYGGEDGPQIPLCLAHHDLLHLIAVKLISKKDPSPLLPKGDSVRSKLLILSGIIVTAQKKFGSDPNKRLTTSITLPKSRMEKLDKLAKFTNLSRHQLLQKLVSDKFNEVFQEDF